MLGKHIKDLRERNNIAHAELAHRVGIKTGELASIEDKNVNRLPVQLLMKIADNLKLKKANDFVSLLQTNGIIRRFQVYCLGLPKTGTVSVNGIFGNYRTRHEFKQWEAHQTIIQYKQKKISRQQFFKFLQDRDVAGKMEMDSAHFNRHYIGILAQEFPEAKFICTLRDCYSWVDSLINYFTIPEREAIQSQELGNGIPFDLPRGACQAKEELISNFHKYIDTPLRFWTNEYRKMIADLPSGRSLLIRTHELADNIELMARLANVSVDTLLPQNSHLNKADYHVKILNQHDRNFLKDKFDLHCGEIMKKYFPDYTLNDYLDGNPIPPHPNWRQLRLT